jgi:predicted secreted protein
LGGVLSFLPFYYLVSQPKTLVAYDQKEHIIMLVCVIHSPTYIIYVTKASAEMTVSDETFVLLVIENYWGVLNGVELAEPNILVLNAQLQI